MRVAASRRVAYSSQKTPSANSSGSCALSRDRADASVSPVAHLKEVLAPENEERLAVIASATCKQTVQEFQLSVSDGCATDVQHQAALLNLRPRRWYCYRFVANTTCK